jgi:hypothetical protein
MGTSICCRIVVVRLIAWSPDRDGAIDLLITTCSSVSRSTGLGTNCALNIAYNTQLPLCASSTSFPLLSDPAAAGPCRNPAALCVADTNFSFSFSGPVRTRRNPSTPHLITIWFKLNSRTTRAFLSVIFYEAIRNSMSSTRPFRQPSPSYRAQATPIWTDFPTCS